MELKDLSKEQISNLILLLDRSPNEIRDELSVRRARCGDKWDDFLRFHRQSDTPLPRIVQTALDVSTMPLEDLPLYLNEIDHEMVNSGRTKRKTYKRTFVLTRLKEGF
jgi:hypothetical protein